MTQSRDQISQDLSKQLWDLIFQNTSGSIHEAIQLLETKKDNINPNHLGPYKKNDVEFKCTPLHLAIKSARKKRNWKLVLTLIYFKFHVEDLGLLLADAINSNTQESIEVVRRILKDKKKCPLGGYYYVGLETTTQKSLLHVAVDKSPREKII